MFKSTHPVAVVHWLFQIVTAFLVANSTTLAQETRTLEFPAGRSMGLLYVGPEKSTSMRDVGVFRDFQEAGQAQGTVEVPADSLIRLDVGIDACKDLSRLAQLPPDAIDFLYFNIEAPVHGQIQHLSGLTGLRWLFFRSCPLKDSDIQHLASLTNLEWIQCSTYGHTDAGFGITDAAMPVFSNMKELKRLDLRANPVTDAGLVSLALCDSLESLSLAGAEVTGTGLDALLMLPNLKTLSFGVYNSGAPIDDKGMKVIGQLPNLEDLNLSATRVTDEGFQYIQNLKTLKNLTLDYTVITDSGLQYLVGLDELSKLRFQRENGAGLGDEAAKHLSRLPKLSDLTVDWNLTSEGIAHLSNAPALKDLSLGHTTTDEDLAEVAKMTALTEFSVQNCKITDAGIAHLTSLVNLESILLHGTKATPACIDTIVSFPKLKRLYFSLEQSGDAPYLWPDLQEWQRLGELKNLESLSVDGMLLDSQHWETIGQLKSLTRLEINTRAPIDGSLIRSLQNLPALQSLEFSASNLIDQDFERLAQLSNIGNLSFAGDINDKQLLMLSKMPRLRRLTVSGDPELTEEAIADFKKQAPALQGFNSRSQPPAKYRINTNSHGILVHGTEESRSEIRDMIGQAAPVLKLSGLPLGDSMDLSQYRGKVVVVHFWRALTIGREARPDELHVRDITAQFSSDDVQVIGVHIVDDETRMRTFVEEQDIEWPCFVDTDGATVADWHSSGKRNDLYIVDVEGNVLMGGVYQGDLERALNIAVHGSLDSEPESDK